MIFKGPTVVQRACLPRAVRRISCPVHAPAEDFSGNIERFTGFADLYDCGAAVAARGGGKLRRSIPGAARPALVVDLAVGRGSRRLLGRHAERVNRNRATGDMRRRAKR